MAFRTSDTNPIDTPQWVMREGFPYDFNITYNGVFPVAQTPMGSVKCAAGESIYISSLTAEADYACNIVPFINDANSLPTTGNSFVSAHRGRIPPDGGIDPLNAYNQILLPSHTFRASIELGDGTSNGRAVLKAIAHRISCYTNIHARFKCYQLGDSITRGLTVPADCIRSDMYYSMGIDYLHTRGVDIQWIPKALGGITTAVGDYWLKYGMLDHMTGAVFNYALGTNDAIQGISLATSVANLRRMIDWMGYKFRKITVFGPPPLNNTTSENNAVLLRQAFKDVVDSYGNGNILFCNLAHNYIEDPGYDNPPSPDNPANYVFDRTNNAGFYTSSDSIHPNIAGNQAIGGNSYVPWLAINPLFSYKPILSL